MKTETHYVADAEIGEIVGEAQVKASKANCPLECLVMTEIQ